MEVKERNYGIDLLRSVAMFMVLILHILGNGGVLKTAKGSPAQLYAAWFLEIAAYCAVNCYALISGYVGYGSKHRYANLAELWLRVAYYTVILTLIFKLIVPDKVTPSFFIKAFLPVSGRQYWYFTAYFLMFLFLPLIEPGLKQLSRKQLRRMLASVLFLLTVAGPIMSVFLDKDKKDMFLIKGGYSMIWLLVLYILGAYIRRFSAFKNISALKALIGYVSMVILTFAAKYLSDFLKAWNEDSIPLINVTAAWLKKSVSYCSPTILLSGLFLLLFFSKLKLPAFLKKLTAFFAPLSFSVYLIHTNPLIWRTLMRNTFSSFASFSVPMLIIAVLGCAFTIFVFCSLLDTVRNAIFKKLKIKARLSSLEDKFLSEQSKNEPLKEQQRE
ncbi:MAG: acyltransferase family protein [Acutalibacteraceae bacterium]